MSNNYSAYGYENEKFQKRSSLLRRLIIVTLIIISIIIVLFLIKSCNNSNNKKIKNEFDYESSLVEAANKYFEKNQTNYPSNIGECEEIELQALIDRNFVKGEDYTKCNKIKTYVKVCMLENKKIHYSPWIACADKNSEDEYTGEFIGTLSNIKSNSTMVSFKFVPQELVSSQEIYGNEEELWKDEIRYNSYKTISTTNYYRYRDELFLWEIKNKKYYTTLGEKDKSSDVNEYYKTSPDSRYNLKDNAQIGYKWFTTSSKKTYAVDSKGNKILSAVKIEGYPYSEQVTCMQYQTRNITGSKDPNHYYKCAKSKNSTNYIYQYEKPCGSKENPTYVYELDNLYTCGYANLQEIINKRVSSKNEKCNSYSEWVYINGSCDITKDTCRKVEPYCKYNWYKIENNALKTYYPSNSNSASSESMYYLKSPINGAIKDENTKSTVYKWYREISSKTNEYTATCPKGNETCIKTKDSKWTDWSEYSVDDPKINDGRNRQIETRTKIKLQEIKGITNDSYKDLSDKYLNEYELIELLKQKNYSVNSLNDITNNGKLKLKIQMLIKNKKESN